MQHLVLASASPQRATLLSGLGLSFVAHPSTYDESLCMQQDPQLRCAELAQKKAELVSIQFPKSFIIGCDTLVVSADGQLLEKASSADDARAAITLLSGRECVVHSGLTLIDPLQKQYSGMSSSKVRFAELSMQQIDWWIDTGLWKDRSGSFQIDGPGQFMIEHIEGDWSSIVGLPVYLLGQLLEEAGYNFKVEKLKS